MPMRRKPRGLLTTQSLDHEGTDRPISPEFELPWTGERLVPSHTGDTSIEHLHRYAFARDYIEGKDVLDIACGEGYGSHLMSNIAANVVGVDISPEVIAHARNRYGDKVTFSVGSCTDIPLSSASVDVVVSFETLEHLAGHEQMLKEVKRVLRPTGVLILSSPDKLNYTILPKTQNPFHVRELSKEEFRSLVGKYFSHCYMFEQKICHGSVLAPTAGLAVTGIRHYMGDFHRLAYTDGIMTPPYNIAVATDDGFQLPHTFSLFQGWDIPTELEKNLSDASATYAVDTGKLQKQLVDVAAAHAAAIGELEKRLVDADAAHAVATGELKRQLADAEAAYAAGGDELKKQLADAEAAYAAGGDKLKKQLVDAEAAGDELKKQLVDAEAAGDKLKKQLVDAEAAGDKLKKQLVDAEAAGDELKKQLVDAEAAGDELKKQLVDAEAAGDELKKRLMDAEAASNELKQAHAAALSESEALRRRMTRIRYRVVDRAAQFVSRILPRSVLSAARTTITRFRKPS
jgi:SAM-dependent methyltransferase